MINTIIFEAWLDEIRLCFLFHRLAESFGQNYRQRTAPCPYWRSRAVGKLSSLFGKPGSTFTLHKVQKSYSNLREFFVVKLRTSLVLTFDSFFISIQNFLPHLNICSLCANHRSWKKFCKRKEKKIWRRHFILKRFKWPRNAFVHQANRAIVESSNQHILKCKIETKLSEILDANYFLLETKKKKKRPPDNKQNH